MLTRKQQELLLFIHERLQRDGVSPSFDEMKDALELKSKSGIHRLISGLEERGFIRRLPHRARALEVIRLPGESMSSGQQDSPTFLSVTNPAAKAESEEVSATHRSPFAEASERKAREARMAADTLSLPLYGRIAAGTPITALSDPSSFVDIPRGMLGSGEHYALEVAGDSMIEAGILDGDQVVIRYGDQAQDGDIVVALVDDEEATLKRLRRKGAEVILEPANARYEPRIFGPGRVRVQGCLVALLRQY